MSDRPHPILEAPACPFVAFDDDRDRRSDEPDHRHRCFAELRPAPRALAHQHAYCLSSSFAACPTFLDWARREAAQIDARRATGEGRDEGRDEGAAAAGAGAGGAAAAAGASLAGTADAARREPPAVDAYDRQAPDAGYPRDWAAAPAWLGGSPSSGAGSSRPGPSEFAPPEEDLEAPSSGEPARRPPGNAPAPAFLAQRDRGPDMAPTLPPAAAPRTPDPDRGFFGPGPRDEEPWGGGEQDQPRGHTPAAAGRNRAGRSDREDARGFDDRGGDRRRVDDNPSWEPRRRVEAYPALKTPMSLPSFNRLGLALVALLVAAVAIFFVPMLLAPKTPGTNTGGGNGPTASPSTGIASPSSSASAPAPSASAAIYVVKAGDTLSRIAGKLGVPLDALIAANPQLPNPDKLSIGDEIHIPTASPSEVPGASASASP